MTGEISKLFITISARSDQFQKQMDSVSKRMQAVGKQMAIVGGVITGAVMGITVAWAKAGDEVAKLAKKTGFSTEALSELRHVAELSGTNLAGLETGIKRMQSTILDASYGMETYTRTFDDLGLSIEDLLKLSPEEQFMTILEALADIEDPTLKAALAVDIFGRAGTDMLPMLSDGAEGLAQMRQEAHDLGIIFDAEAAKQAEEFNDALTRLKAAIKGAVTIIASTLAPIITDLADKITRAVQKIKDWTERHPALTKAIVKVTAAIGALCLALGPLLLMLPTLIRLGPLVGAAFHAMLGPIGLITAAIAGIIAVIVALKSQAGRAMRELKADVKSLGDTIVSELGTATKQAISDVENMTNQQKAEINDLISFLEGKQYEGMELLPEDTLEKIRAIKPELADQLQAIQDKIRGIREEYGELDQEVSKERIAEIQLQLGKPGLTKQETMDLLDELATLTSKEWQNILEANEPDIVAILEQQKTDLDTGLADQLDSWNNYFADIEAGWDGSLVYLQSIIIPALNKAVAEGLITSDIADDLIEQFEKALANYEVVMKPTVSGHYTAEAELPRFIFEFQKMQRGGLITSPTLAMVGEGGPEAVLPLNELGSELGKRVEIHNHFGVFVGDEIALRKLHRMMQQVAGEETRRTQFNPIRGGDYYNSGRASL